MGELLGGQWHQYCYHSLMQSRRVLVMVAVIWVGVVTSAHARNPSAASPAEFTPQIAVYGELGGSALVTSVNVEFRPVEILNLRVGGMVDCTRPGAVYPAMATLKRPFSWSNGTHCHHRVRHLPRRARRAPRQHS